jgi:hypothetical protein
MPITGTFIEEPNNTISSTLDFVTELEHISDNPSVGGRYTFRAILQDDNGDIAQQIWSVDTYLDFGMAIQIRYPTQESSRKSPSPGTYTLKVQYKEQDTDEPYKTVVSQQVEVLPTKDEKTAIGITQTQLLIAVAAFGIGTQI